MCSRNFTGKKIINESYITYPRPNPKKNPALKTQSPAIYLKYHGQLIRNLHNKFYKWWEWVEYGLFTVLYQYLQNSEFKQTAALSLKRSGHQKNNIIEFRTSPCKCIGHCRKSLG